MTSTKKYRFKTQEEFFTQYGKNWRDDIPGDLFWPEKMDKYFGQPYEGSPGKLTLHYNYGVSSDMITLVGSSESINTYDIY